MKTFQYSTRDYVPSVDLNTLGKTFDTLEQGHKEAVKAASDLEVTMANLPLNEAENEWRQQKINEIKQTIDNNTIFGNSYAALDDLILKSGNLMADQGMIGRLQAQKDFKDFETRVLNDQSLPQNYKEYYLEKNPYHYEDKYDNKGNLIGGTKWEPNVSPTNVIPLNQLIAQGISIAAKEHGGGTITRWLDESGHVTIDPMKAFDGEVFNTTTQQWDRLSKEKIWQAVRGIINTTPGAAESLQQDYDVAYWEHSKAVKANGGKPIISEITDSNGVILSPEQYLFKRVDPAVQAASYYNSTSSTTYGKGLQTYKSAQAKIAAAEQERRLRMDKAMMSGKATPVEIESPFKDKDAELGKTLETNRVNAKNNIENLYKSVTGVNIDYELSSTHGATITVNGKDLDGNEQLIRSLQRRGANQKQIADMRKYINDYNNAKNGLNSLTSVLTPTQKNIFNFNTRMSTSGELKSSTWGGTEFDDRIIDEINGLYGKGDKMVINVKDNNMMRKLINDIGETNIEALKYRGLTFKNNQIIIPKKSICTEYIPLIFSHLSNSYDEYSSWYKDKFSEFTIQTYGYINGKYGEIDTRKENKFAPQSDGYTISDYIYDNWKRFDNIVSIYNQGTDISSIAANPSTITVSSLNLDGKNFTHNLLYDNFTRGIIDGQTYNESVEYFNNSFTDIIKNEDFSQFNMYLSEDGGTRKLVKESSARYSLGTEIQEAMRDNRVTFSPTIVPNFGGAVAGYNITISPKVEGGVTKSIYIPNLINETAAEAIMSNPKIQAFNDIAIAGGTQTSINFSYEGINSNITNRISIKGLGNDKYVASYEGTNAPLTTEQATDLATALNSYNSVLLRISADPNAIHDKYVQNTINESVDIISATFGLKQEDVMYRAGQDLLNYR